MRILYVVTKSNWGGAQRYVYDLALAAQSGGHEVAVALGGGGELLKRLREADITIFSLQSMQRDLSIGSDTGSLQELSKILRDYQPEVVHLNSSKAGGLGALAARRAGIKKIIFTAHGWPFEEKRSVFWRLFALLGSYATALLASSVIVVSKKDLRIGKRMPFAAFKMQLIYNGIDLTAPLGSGAVIREAFPEGVKITGTIGELTHNKNQIALIEEARINLEQYVAIVGEGEDRTYLTQKIKEYGLESRVKLFGFIPEAEVLKGFDEFVLFSKKEGLPYVLIAARAAGLPIRASRVGGIPDILDATDLTGFSKAQMVEKTLALYQA